MRNIQHPDLRPDWAFSHPSVFNACTGPHLSVSPSPILNVFHGLSIIRAGMRDVDDREMVSTTFLKKRPLKKWVNQCFAIARRNTNHFRLADSLLLRTGIFCRHQLLPFFAGGWISKIPAAGPGEAPRPLKRHGSELTWNKSRCWPASHLMGDDSLRFAPANHNDDSTVSTV